MIRHAFISVRLLLFLLTTGMACAVDVPGDSTSTALAKALLEMTRQKSDQFVIVEDPGSEKFIQFAFSENKSILMDIPKQEFTAAELQQSGPTLKQHGLKEVTFTARDPKTQVGFGTVSFQKEFAVKDADKASELTILLHDQLFHSKAANLKIVRGWEP